MTILKTNMLANFVGSLWQGLMALLFIPLYVKFLGIEAYGLVGLFMTMQALFMFLDMGLGATVNREMARLSALPDKAQDMRNLVRSLELIYWCIAVVIGLLVIVLSPYIAHQWVRPEKLSPTVIQRTVMIMGLALAVQWPVSFYSGGLVGLQHQVLLNVINCVIAAFRWCGAALVLWVVAPTIYVFFVWQILASILHVSMTFVFLWRRMPAISSKPVFQRTVILGVWRFALGMSGIVILATLLTQTDKLILSRMLSLEMFGYYTLAGLVAMTLYRLVGPVFSAVYPRFTQLVTLNDQQALKELYHRTCQFMSVLILPAAAVVAFFSYEILLIWTQNPTMAEKTYLLVSILVIGTSLNGLMNLPYALQLAHGWTRLTFYVNLASVIVLVPFTIFMTKEYGAVGAAIVWIVLNSGYLIITIQLMHRRLLKREKWTWYGKDIGIPLVVAFVVAGLGRIVMNVKPLSQTMTLVMLIAVSMVTLVATSLVTQTTREFVFNKLMHLGFNYENSNPC
jgi:O-antigen/teichoic acid export membrane protein